MQTGTTKAARIVGDVVLGLMVVAAWLGVTFTSPGLQDRALAEGGHPDCQEDEACWDCETMGNEICGPVKVYTCVGLTCFCEVRAGDEYIKDC